MMKKLLFCFYSFLLICSSILPVYAAEYPLSGPDIVIDIEIENEPVYVSILCETNNPINDRYSYRSWPEKYDIKNYDSISIKFEKYAESIDYFFVDEFVCLSKEKSVLEWYGKTPSFKILVYFPETDSFLISDEIEIQSSYLSKYNISFNEKITVESVNPYPTLLPLCFAVCIGSILIRLILSFLFKYHQSKHFSLLVNKTIAVSFLYSFLLAVTTYYNGKTAFIVIEFLCFWILLIFEYLFCKFKLSLHSYHFLYSLLCNIIHFLFCFHLFNSYIW